MTHLDPKALNTLLDQFSELIDGGQCLGPLDMRRLREAVAAERAALPQAEPVAWQWQQCKSAQPGVWPDHWNNIELRPGEDRVQYWRDLSTKLPDGVRVRPLFASPAVSREDVIEQLQEAVDLLAERRYGSPARSPGHNARLVVERVIRALSQPHSEK